jgi:hypothetical protein
MEHSLISTLTLTARNLPDRRKNLAPRLTLAAPRILSRCDGLDGQLPGQPRPVARHTEPADSVSPGESFLAVDTGRNKGVHINGRILLLTQSPLLLNDVQLMLYNGFRKKKHCFRPSGV